MRLSRLIVLLALGSLFMWPSSSAQADADSPNAYDFSFTTLVGGQPLPLSDFKGKVILVVNTASQCGFTGQYDGLEKLYEQYKDQGLVIVGVPSNDFGKQEPGTNEEISHFCKLNYGVSFPMASKEDVIGDDAHPFYKWANDKVGFLGRPKWNFHKYLIDRSGNLVTYFHSTTKPADADLIEAIEANLKNTAR